jgi:hypothetical protein
VSATRKGVHTRERTRERGSERPKAKHLATGTDVKSNALKSLLLLFALFFVTL